MLWLVLGLIIGGAVVWLLKSAKCKIEWYQWVLGALSVILLLFTLQNVLGFAREIESVAITFTLFVVGLPAVILGVLAVFLPKFLKTSGQASKNISG